MDYFPLALLSVGWVMFAVECWTALRWRDHSRTAERQRDEAIAIAEWLAGRRR